MEVSYFGRLTHDVGTHLPATKRVPRSLMILRPDADHIHVSQCNRAIPRPTIWCIDKIAMNQTQRGDHTGSAYHP